MKRCMAVLFATAGLVAAGFACAVPSDYKLTTQGNDPLVKELEGRLRALTGAAVMGDLAGARALRPAAVNKSLRTPYTRDTLKTAAPVIAPNLSGYRFVQMESSSSRARLVYEKRSPDQLTILVQLFVKEGDWKVGSNHLQAYVGKPPNTADAIAAALKSPAVQLP